MTALLADIFTLPNQAMADAADAHVDQHSKICFLARGIDSEADRLRTQLFGEMEAESLFVIAALN